MNLKSSKFISKKVGFVLAVIVIFLVIGTGVSLLVYFILKNKNKPVSPPKPVPKSVPEDVLPLERMKFKYVKCSNIMNTGIKQCIPVNYNGSNSDGSDYIRCDENDCTNAINKCQETCTSIKKLDKSCKCKEYSDDGKCVQSDACIEYANGECVKRGDYQFEPIHCLKKNKVDCGDDSRCVWN